MKIKECYVSHNGISCITSINSLIDLKFLNLDTIKKNVLVYIIIRSSELIITDFIKNKFYLFDTNYVDTNLLPNIMFS